MQQFLNGTYMLRRLLSVIFIFTAIALLTACIDNPAVHPSSPPYLITNPYGVPHYPGPRGTPVYPDRAIYYPDGTVYCPQQHYYYRYGRDYGRIFPYQYSNYSRYGKSLREIYCN